MISTHGRRIANNQRFAERFKESGMTVLDLPGYMQIFITYRRTALSATEALADLLAASFEQHGEEKSIVREPL